MIPSHRKMSLYKKSIILKVAIIELFHSKMDTFHSETVLYKNLCKINPFKDPSSYKSL